MEIRIRKSDNDNKHGGNNKFKKSKKAVSPVVSTILLIVIVIIIAAIILLWARGFLPEILEKFGKPVDRSCQDLDYEASISEGELYIVNNGNVPVHKVEIKKHTRAETITQTEEVSEEPINLNADGNINDYDEITIIPVLLAKSGKQNKEYTCAESFGKRCIKQDDSFIC
jgi:flagellin-like protein